jgi:hypothetical protein
MCNRLIFIDIAGSIRNASFRSILSLGMIDSTLNHSGRFFRLYENYLSIYIYIYIYILSFSDGILVRDDPVVIAMRRSIVLYHSSIVLFHSNYLSISMSRSFFGHVSSTLYIIYRSITHLSFYLYIYSL